MATRIFIKCLMGEVSLGGSYSRWGQNRSYPKRWGY